MLRSLVILAVLATGCSTDTTTRSSETYTATPTPRQQGDKIEASLLEGFATGPDVSVSSAECPEIDPDAGGQYVCDLVSHGVPFEVDVTMTPEPQPDGSSRMKIKTSPQGVLFPADIAASLVDQARANTGTPIEVACESPSIRRATPGDRFACVATDQQTGGQVPLVVTVTNDEGGWNANAGTL